MKLIEEQEVICKVFSEMRKDGKVHCYECPMRLHNKDCVCLKMADKDTLLTYCWKGSLYPALEGENDG